MEEPLIKYATEMGVTGLLAVLCIYLVIHFNKTIQESTKANQDLAKAITGLTNATDKQILQLEKIEGNTKRTEDKVDRLRDEFMSFKSKFEL